MCPREGQAEGDCEQGPDDIICAKEMQEQETTKNSTRRCFTKDTLVGFQAFAVE